MDTPLPVNDTKVDELCTRIRKADPDANLNEFNVYTNYRESFFDPDYLFFSVCGNCAMEACAQGASMMGMKPS